MTSRRKSSWQERTRRSDGPRLLDGEVPEGVTQESGMMGHFSWRLALGIIGLGTLAALVAHYAC